MNYILYFGLLIMVGSTYLFDIRIGKIKINRMLDKCIVVGFIIFTIYIYYASKEALDSINYQVKFDYIDDFGEVTIDILFTLIIRFIKNFTVDYQIFRAIVGGAFLLPICVIMYCEKKIDIALFLLLCMIFPYFQSIVALRDTLATAICILAFYYYFSSRQVLQSKIVTFCLLFISIFIHDTHILYVLLFVAYLALKRISNKTLLLYLILGIDIFLVCVFRIGIINNFLNALAGSSNTQYILGMRNIGVGFLVNALLQLGYTYLLYSIIKKGELEGEIRNKSEDIFFLNICAVIFIPLYSINVLFFRMFRGLLVLDFIVWASFYKYHKKDYKLILILLLEVFCMLYDANGINSIISIF